MKTETVDENLGFHGFPAKPVRHVRWDNSRLVSLYDGCFLTFLNSYFSFISKIYIVVADFAPSLSFERTP